MDDIGWFIGITFLLAMGFVGGCLGVAVLTLGAVCLKKIQGWRAGVVVLVLLVPGVGWADEPKYSQEGYLKVTKGSLDALLRDYPDAHVRVMPMDPCLAQMEALLHQLELDFVRMEKQQVAIPMSELRAMLERRPMWVETKRECWKAAQP